MGKAERRYLFTVGGQSDECPIRFECVEVFSPDWLIGVLARVNRWRPPSRRPPSPAAPVEPL